MLNTPNALQKADDNDNEASRVSDLEDYSYCAKDTASFRKSIGVTVFNLHRPIRKQGLNRDHHIINPPDK